MCRSISRFASCLKLNLIMLMAGSPSYKKGESLLCVFYFSYLYLYFIKSILMKSRVRNYVIVMPQRVLLDEQKYEASNEIVWCICPFAT